MHPSSSHPASDPSARRRATGGSPGPERDLRQVQADPDIVGVPDPSLVPDARGFRLGQLWARFVVSLFGLVVMLALVGVNDRDRTLVAVCAALVAVVCVFHGVRFLIVRRASASPA